MRLPRWGLLSAASMSAWFGCLPDATGPEAEPYVQLIAVEARVELVIKACESDRALVSCLPRPLRSVDELTVSGESFSLRGTREQDGELFAEIEALVVGDGTVSLVYTDDSGRERRAEVPLRAVEVDSVAITAECPLARAPREPYRLGAGTELSLRWEPRSQGRFVSTGQLPVIDFGDFELVSSEPYRATLRAPQAPGAYDWHDRAGADHAVEVYDHTSFPLRLQRLSGTPQRARVSSELGDAVVCTPPTASSAVELRVASGACALGLGGVEADPSLWLTFAPDGTTFEVYGRGHCTLSAQLGDQAANVTISDVTSSAPGDGSIVESEPVTFARLEPLPSTTCDRGATDGKCELSRLPIPDADCLTDADWTVELYDSAGPIGDGDFIGTSLTFSIALGISVGPSVLEGHRAPMDVKVAYDERLFGLLGSAEDVNVSIGECVAPTGETRVAQVRVSSVGPHQLEFTASNLNDTAEVDFAARGVDRCPIQAKIGDERTSKPELSVLEGSTLELSARCERADGLALRGDAQLSVAREAGEPPPAAIEQALGKARITNTGVFYMGAGPASYLVSSLVGEGRQRIVVLPASTVVSLQAAPLAPETERPDVHCTEAIGEDASGQPLPGTPAARVRVTLPEDGSWVLDAASLPRRVCVRKLGSSPPGATLGLALGSATLELALP